MPVHQQSVIPRRLEGYWPEAYTALTTQEYFCYEKSRKGGVTQYRPFFQSLASQIDAWFNVSRTSVVRDLLEKAFVYILFGNNYGTSTSCLSRFDAYALFDIKGFLKSTTTRAENYYDDFIPEKVTTTSTGQGTTATQTEPAKAPRLEADTRTVSEHLEDENEDASDLADEMGSASSQFSFKMLFEEPPKASSYIGQEEIGQIVFEDHHWKEAFDYLNINLDKPSYIS